MEKDGLFTIQRVRYLSSDYLGFASPPECLVNGRLCFCFATYLIGDKSKVQMNVKRLLTCVCIFGRIT